MIFKNAGECFSSVGGSKIHVFSVFPDLGKNQKNGGGSAALAKPLNYIWPWVGWILEIDLPVIATCNGASDGAHGPCGVAVSTPGSESMASERFGLPYDT